MKRTAKENENSPYTHQDTDPSSIKSPAEDHHALERNKFLSSQVYPNFGEQKKCYKIPFEIHLEVKIKVKILQCLITSTSTACRARTALTITSTMQPS